MAATRGFLDWSCYSPYTQEHRICEKYCDYHKFRNLRFENFSTLEFRRTSFGTSGAIVMSTSTKFSLCVDSRQNSTRIERFENSGKVPAGNGFLHSQNSWWIRTMLPSTTIWGVMQSLEAETYVDNGGPQDNNAVFVQWWYELSLLVKYRGVCCIIQGNDGQWWTLGKIAIVTSNFSS